MESPCRTPRARRRGCGTAAPEGPEDRRAAGPRHLSRAGGRSARRKPAKKTPGARTGPEPQTPHRHACPPRRGAVRSPSLDSGRLPAENPQRLYQTDGQEADLPSDRRSHKRVTIYRSELPDTGELREVEYAAVSEALHFACRDLREGRRRPLQIIEDDVVVFDAEAIARQCEERQADEDLTRRIAEATE
jgi:hypothetical protein